jgi:hypothetical protein
MLDPNLTCLCFVLRGYIASQVVILPNEHHQSWLAEASGKEVLLPYPSDLMSAYPISLHVNSPANNDPDILKPIWLCCRSAAVPKKILRAI